MRYCPHCGERVEEADAYCFECGTALDGTPNGDRSRDRGRSPRRREEGIEPRQSTRDRETATGPREPTRGGETATGPREPTRGREAAVGQQAGGTRVQSLTTLRVAAGLSVVAILEGLGAVLFADQIAEQIQEFDFGTEITANAVAIQGGLGVVVALGVAALCYYYHRQGYVDRRFFWGVIGGGVAGFFLGSAISFLLLIIVGGYGLLVVLRREPSGDRPVRGRDAR